MSIRIDENTCIGCRSCAAVCPGNLIKVENEKAYMKYPKDCWGCAACVKECCVGAIHFYLGADLGGRGATMQASDKGEILQWKIMKPDGSVISIDVSRANSNNY